MASVTYMARHDRRPALSTTLQDANSAAVDLTTATTVYLHLVREDDRSVAVNAEADIDADPTSGVVSYAWADGDTDTAGRYLAEWVVTWADATTQTFPNNEHDLVIVSDDLA